MQLLLLLVSCTLLGTAAVRRNCEKKKSKAHPKSRIVGGEEAGEHEAPYFVSIDSRTSTHTEFCGGTIISKNCVLTAAHCMYKSYYNEITAGVHMLHELGPYRIMFVNGSYYIHENYDPNNVHYDLAIIKLPYSIPQYNQNVQAAKLPRRSQANANYVGTVARIYGRGDFSDDQPITMKTEAVRYVDVPVITNTQCQNGGIVGAEIYSGNMCTSGANGKGACMGDSGGPLVYNGVQIGAVSYGDSPCAGGKPTVYADLGKFLDWIAAHCSDVIIES